MAPPDPTLLRVGARVVIDAERVGKNLVAHHIEATPAASGHMHPGRSAATPATTVQQHAGHETRPPQQAGAESASPQHAGHQATTPEHAGHETTPPQQAGADSTSPQHAGHQITTPEHAGHETTPPQQAGTESTSPQHAGHQTTPPEHAGHETTPPQQAGAESTSPQHAGHQMPGMGSGTAQHQMGTMGGPMEHPSRTLFQSDMTMMAGMTAEDPMAAMAMKDWTRMDLGIGRLVFNHQGGPSGRDAVESSNWNMIMFQKDVLGGRVTLMMMNSLEPATLRKGGSPELFQTGETYKGQPLVDRQHPHDLFMNISATYRHPVGEHGAWWVQLAPRGEPALGPTAFMHRASAGENPSATLGHHWQDATHITDDVATVGGGWRRVSLEASAFHGAEPDENRWDLDPGALDSVSGRAKFQLSDDWSAQVSYGFLKHPEALTPGDLRRTTASVHYGAAGNSPFAASAIWGRDREEHLVSDAWLLEAAWQLTMVDQVYGRAEAVDKDRELLLKKDLTGHDPAASGTVTIRALTLGYLRDFELWHRLKAGLGVDATIYGYPSELDRAYGDFPVSFHVFVRLRWGHPHMMGGHGGTMKGM
jgi:hypothetical protein